jgi:hypothetical protein
MVETSRLESIRNTCLLVASEETAYNRHYTGGLHNHCGPVSFVVQRLLGGHILWGTVHGSRHYWNKLPCGRECDLTSCQFGGDGLTPVATGTLAPPRKHINPRFSTFWSRFYAEFTKW